MPWGVAAAAVVGAVSQNVASNRASSATDRASRSAEGHARQAAIMAKGDVNRLFPAAIDTAKQGFQGALDVFGQSVPAQMGVFQQGNVAGQQAILAGLPQIQNAILGGNVDLSGLQPFRANTPDSSMFQQQIPQETPFVAPTNDGLHGFTNQTTGPQHPSTIDPLSFPSLVGGVSPNSFMMSPHQVNSFF